MLADKSLTDLRNIAQGLGCRVEFSDDKKALVQKIELRSVEVIPPRVEIAPATRQDLRLLNRPPTDCLEQKEVTELLQPYIDAGLVLTYPTLDEWHMRWAAREDSGSLRAELRTLLNCARRLQA